MKLRLSRRHALLGLAIGAPGVAGAARAKARLSTSARLGVWVKSKASAADLLALRPRVGAADIQASLLQERSDTLAQAMSADFAAERTMIVDGWLLSQTECALYVASLEKALA